MSECAREITWAGGTHVFDLNRPDVLAVLSQARHAPKMARTRAGVLELLPLTGRNGDTPAAALKRFDEGSYSIEDIERVILYGLWGGGLSLSAAEELVRKHVTGKPLAHAAQLAFTVLSALFIGAADNADANPA